MLTGASGYSEFVESVDRKTRRGSEPNQRDHKGREPLIVIGYPVKLLIKRYINLFFELLGYEHYY